MEISNQVLGNEWVNTTVSFDPKDYFQGHQV